MNLQHIESLESRRLLSTVITQVTGDTITVSGTDHNDTISLNVRTDRSGLKVLDVQTLEGTRKYDLTGVNNIRVESLDGDDRVIVDPSVVRPIYINGGLGNDTLTGGAGADTLTGGRGNDFLQGRDGNDRLNGYSGIDNLHGDSGNDRLYGGEDNDLLVGGKGNDQLTGEAGDDQLYGEDGNDKFFIAKAGVDTVNGGSGSDSVQRGGDVNDTVAQIEFDIV